MKNKEYLKELLIDVLIFTGIFVGFVTLMLFVYKFII